MARKPITIWVETDTLVRLKQAALQAGSSLSNRADSTLRRGLDAEGSGKTDTGPGIGEILASGFDDVKAGIRNLGRALSETRPPETGAAGGYPWTREQVRFLIYTLARLNRFFEEYNAAWGQHDPQVTTRAETANKIGDLAVKKYLPGGDDNVR